jgi:hypothetical protein
MAVFGAELPIASRAMFSRKMQLLGSWTGVSLYRRTSEVNFRRAVLILLIVSGVSLVAKTLI